MQVSPKGQQLVKDRALQAKGQSEGWDHAKRQRLMATSQATPMTRDLKLSWEHSCTMSLKGPKHEGQGSPSQRSSEGWEHAKRQRLMATSQATPMTRVLQLPWEPTS